jgi:hypothetical protein
MRSSTKPIIMRSITLFLFTSAFWLRGSPAFAVDEVEFFCNGSSGATCDTFQLDGADTSTGAADSCVGTETGCPNEENPVWPADWDALLFPSLTTASPAITPISGTPPGAWSFALPWGAVGSFSGIFTSSLVSTGTSTILKQGSKNGNDVSTWVVATQSAPPKDAFLAASLAASIAPSNQGAVHAGDQLLYHGATRVSPNGSATEGLWFFQQGIEVCASGPNAGKALCLSGTTTLAQHKVNDLFLFITYGGNGTATIQAATWQGADGPAGHLGTAPGSIVACPTSGDNVCAVTNESSAITLGSPSGPQLPGTGFNVTGPGFAGFPGGVVPALQFQEGGLDVTSILSGTTPCFSTVMFATVSSGSSPGTASLKAILLGSTNTCAISATKACGNPVPDVPNSTVTYTISGTVTNTGGGSVENLKITDTFNGNPQAISGLTCSCGTGCTITGSDCATAQVQSGGTVNYSATMVTSANGGSDVVTATMSGLGGGSATATSNTAACPTVTLSDSITVSKTCDTSLVSSSCGLTVQVGASGMVNNTGQLSLSNVTVSDCRGGTFTTMGDPSTCTAPGGAVTVATFSSLAAGASQSYTDTFTPTSLPSDATSNVCPNGTFSDTVLVKGTCTSAFCATPTVFNEATASCPLCPLH